MRGKQPRPQQEEEKKNEPKERKVYEISVSLKEWLRVKAEEEQFQQEQQQ